VRPVAHEAMQPSVSLEGERNEVRVRTSPARINIASGAHVLPGYINFDNSIYLLLVPLRRVLHHFVSSQRAEQIERFYQAKKRASLFYRDCTKPLDLPDNSINEVYCSHFLEHVYKGEASAIVKDFYRVLKKGGKLIIVVPDLEKYIAQYLQSEANHKRADDFIKKTLLSVEERPSLWKTIVQFFRYSPNHKWLYDEGSITALVKECGFVSVTSSKEWEESLRITAVR
jgi:predicted SAM-dependent methyltransferase